ncbi:hypothetical protein [uncultured Lactobacillus sp.]|uniref:hypothetical protein n=1 Tax=uncultured Lactobacillus sp. TaxID=153152 RepID=UPI00260FDB91|nr:hypothetical protein [uncultured Lactobacillus sp.]
MDKQRNWDVHRLVKLGIIFSLIMIVYIFIQSWSQNGYSLKALSQMPIYMAILLAITEIVMSSILGFIFAGIVVTKRPVWNPSMKNLTKGFLLGVAWTIIDVFGLGFGTNSSLTLMQNVFSFASLLDLIVGTIIGFYLFSSKPAKNETEKKN